MTKEKISLIFLYFHTHKLSLSRAATICTLLSIFLSTHSSLFWLSSFSKWLPLGCSFSSSSCAAPFFFFLNYTAISFFFLCGTLKSTSNPYFNNPSHTQILNPLVLGILAGHGNNQDKPHMGFNFVGWI